MLQRPGCFVFYVLVAFIGLAMFIGWVNETRSLSTASANAATPFADGQQNAEAVVAPTASATIAMTPTPNPLVLTEASSNATHSAALTALANDQATQDAGTRIASTQTPAAWTAEAVDVEQQRQASVRDKALLEAQLLAGTITAAPTSQWKTEVAYWPTMKAEQTQAAFDQDLADRRRWWSRINNELLSVLMPALLVCLILAMTVSSIVMPAALSWRLQGVNGGQAQATVEAARSVTVNENKQSRQMVTDGERAQLIAFVDECIKTSGPDARQITPQSEFESAETWSQMVRRLRAMGLVTPQRGNGNGTDINGGLTLSGLALALRKGTTA